MHDVPTGGGGGLGVERGDLSGAGKDGGEDPKGTAAAGKAIEGGHRRAHAAEADEGGDDVDAIG